MRNIIKWLKQAIFPHFCFVCGDEGTVICPACLVNEMARQRGVFRCPSCGDTNEAGERCRDCDDDPNALRAVVSIGKYSQVGPRQLLQGWKYDVVAEAGNATLSLWRAFWREHEPWLHAWAGDAVIIPVPIHPWRRAIRGFNQAEALAATLARIANRPCRDILQRRFSWRRQAEFLHDENRRRANVVSKFTIRLGAIAPSRVILIDDVYTTGATLDACAAALYAAGTKEVRAITYLRA